MNPRNVLAAARIRRLITLGAETPTYEELLVGALPNIGPLVAIGNPADKLAHPAGHHTYPEHTDWRVLIRELLIKAQISLISIGESNGLLWEIEQVTSTVQPERIILCLPICKTVAEKEQRYRGFRIATLGIFPRPLPEKVGDAQFLYFDTDWTPHRLTTERDDPVLNLPSLKTPGEGAQVEVLDSLNRRFVADMDFHSPFHQVILLLRACGTGILAILSLLAFFALISLLISP
jgi:hypothetical protein